MSSLDAFSCEIAKLFKHYCINITVAAIMSCWTSLQIIWAVV